MRIFLHLSPPKSTLRFLVLVIIGISSFKPIQGADKSSETHSADGSLLSKPSEKSVRPGKSDSTISPDAGAGKARLGLAAPVFIENKGQFDESVKFRVVGNGASLWLTKDGIVFDFLRVKKTDPKATSPLAHKAPAADQESTRIVFAQKFVAGNSGGQIEAKDPIPGTYNYFIGSDASKWVTHVRAYREIVYRDVWQGIDVKLVANGRNLEEELIVHPGADLDKARLAYDGIRGLSVSKDGSLKIRTDSGEMTETAPRLYQDLAGKRMPVKGEFKIFGDNTYAFIAAPHRTTVALVVDPTLLYSTFLGGSAGFGCGPFFCATSEQANGIAVDSSGNAYVTGLTASPDFPTTLGVFQTTLNRGSGSAFVTKLNAAGDQFVYSTYFGPGFFASATGVGIAVGSSNEAYITGTASISRPGDFPITPNAYQTVCASSFFFLTKLNAAGDGLVYSTCFGFAGFANKASAIALDSSGRAYITGSVGNFGSTPGSIPTTPGAFQPGIRGGINAFLSVFSPSLSGTESLAYSTYLGTNNDQGEAIAVDSQGNAYIAGLTESRDFPVTAGAFKTTYPGALVDIFVAKLSPSATGAASLIYATFLGGSTPGQEDEPSGIAVDATGAAYVTGSAQTLDFPVTPGAFQTVPGHPGKSNAFVTKLSPAGNSLMYSTLFSGKSSGDGEFANAIALDSSGNAYITGSTNAPDLPTTPDAFQLTYHGGGAIFFVGDAFLTKFDPTGSTLIYSSYLGGHGSDTGAGIAVDLIGDAYITGFTTSPDFPTILAAQPRINLGGAAGPADAFVARFALSIQHQLAVQGFLPVRGGNAGNVTTTISGTGFVAGTAVKLSCPNQPDILATSVTSLSGGRILTASFDLTSATPAICTIVVSNPDGTSATATANFTIEQGGAPQIWVDVIGLDKIRVGRTQTYYVIYGNTGNTDGLGVPVTISVPNGAAVSLGFSITPPPALPGQPPINWGQFSPIVQTPTAQLVPLFIPVIPAGQSAVLPITLTFPSGTPPHFFANIGVSANAPYFGSLSNPVQVFSQASNCIQSLVATAINAIGIVLPASCALQTALTFQSIYFTFVQNSIPPVNGANIIGSASQLLISVALTLANCAGTAVGASQLIQAVSTAYSAYQAFNSCLPVATQLLHAFVFISQDPNDKTGSAGISPQHYVLGAVPLRYAIFFSNLETATAPAEDITVADQLDLTHDDLASFSLGPIAFGDALITPPTGASSFSQTVDLRPANNLLVKVDAALDTSSGLLKWHFTSLDPATNQPPLDPTAGFLPPGGEGSVFFTVMPKADIPTNTPINNQATIVFDANAPIPTQPWLNTIDNDKPTSHVLALPGQSPAAIPLQWTGADVGAGVQDFTIFVSDNGSPFTPFLTNTTATSATFPGQPGHTYAFFSTARDLVGNVEDLKTTAEATTTVVTDAMPPATVAVLAPPANANGWNNSNVSISLSSTDNPGGSGVQQVTFNATGAQPIVTTNVPGSSASTLISTEGVTNFSFFATDFAGNSEAAHSLVIKLDKTPPSITGARTPLANANGWNNTNVTVSFACADSLSGLALGSPPASTLISSEGVNQQVSGVCQDLAGNTDSATVSGINIDKTPPVIAGLPAAGCTLTETSKLVQVATVSSSDALSGLVSFDVIVTSSQTSDDVNEPDIVITGSGLQPRTVQLRPKVRNGSASRTFTLTSTATDVAGNTTTAVSTCTVPHDQGN